MENGTERTMTAMRAIRAKCLDCSGDSRMEVHQCPNIHVRNAIAISQAECFVADIRSDALDARFQCSASHCA